MSRQESRGSVAEYQANEQAALRGKAFKSYTTACDIRCGFHTAFYYDEVVPLCSSLAVFIVKGC